MPKLIDNHQSRLFNRELSWLSFNERVLEEAADTSTPLLERVKFLAIVSSNLEEFFRVRVAALFRKAEELKVAGKKVSSHKRDGIELDRLLATIRSRVLEQKHRQAVAWEQVVMELAKSGLQIDQSRSQMALDIFEEKVLPHLAPLRITPDSKIPPIEGGKIHIVADHPNSFSLIPFPASLPRFFVARSKHILLTDQLIFLYKDLVFKNQEVREIFSFKVSRDADIDLTEDSIDYLDEVEEGIKSRDVGPIVRLEVDSVSLSPAVDWLQKQLSVPDERLYQISLPLDLRSLMPLAELKRNLKLRYHYPAARRPAVLPETLPRQRFFRILEQQDQLLHHPYSAFDPVVDLVRHASEDPKVTRICQTLYRTSGKSAILESLMVAAKNGKKVLALIEIKARFDEANNLKWARALEKAGVRVIYGTPDLKVHAKLTYIERKSLRATDPPREYVHIGTGNYHPKTARYYTDIAILSSKPEYCSEARLLFDLFEKMDNEDDYSLLTRPEEFSANFKLLAVAPAKLHERIIEWIDAETEHAKAGRPASIKAKMNGLVEETVIEALYRASQAGVKIDLLVRGMCCVRPGVAGLSENIRVRSIIDKYLEHSRVFIFSNGGDDKVWISSADWMPRNLFRRVELAVPVLDPKLARYLSEIYWPIYAADNVKARECHSDGRYVRNFHLGTELVRAQFEFEKLEVPNFSPTKVVLTTTKKV
ncbi:MAG: polyphosphate kinase 1 [Bdellovibrionota bacterium]